MVIHVKRNLRMPRLYMSYGRSSKKVPAWMWTMTGVLALSFGVWMCHHAYGALEGNVTLESWALHVGFWWCVVGALGIVRGRGAVSARSGAAKVG